ncbi:MAG: hypothetical protein WBM54_10425 [Woeseia sp.]
MTGRLNIIGAILCCGLLGACADTIECTKPKVYQQAVPGTHVEVPEGLDPLQAEREVIVPQASPDAPGPIGDCLDSPPTLRTGSSDS